MPSPDVSSTRHQPNHLDSSRFCLHTFAGVILLGNLWCTWGSLDVPGSANTHEKWPLSERLPACGYRAKTSRDMMGKAQSHRHWAHQTTHLSLSSTKLHIFLPSGENITFEYIIPIRVRSDVAAALSCCSGNGAYDSVTTSGVKLNRFKNLREQDS